MLLVQTRAIHIEKIVNNGKSFWMIKISIDMVSKCQTLASAIDLDCELSSLTYVGQCL